MNLIPSEGVTVGILLVAIGTFSAAGGVFQWRFFVSNRRFQALEGLMGNAGTRAFYILLGLLVSALGALLIVLY
jgi:hypothetical protein